MGKTVAEDFDELVEKDKTLTESERCAIVSRLRLLRWFSSFNGRRLCINVRLLTLSIIGIFLHLIM